MAYRRPRRTRATRGRRYSNQRLPVWIRVADVKAISAETPLVAFDLAPAVAIDAGSVLPSTVMRTHASISFYNPLGSVGGAALVLGAIINDTSNPVSSYPRPVEDATTADWFGWTWNWFPLNRTYTIPGSQSAEQWHASVFDFKSKRRVTQPGNAPQLLVQLYGLGGTQNCAVSAVTSTLIRPG